MFRYEFIWSYTEKSNFQSWSDLPDKQHIGITPTELKFVIIRLMLLRYCGSTNSGLHSIFSKAVSVSFAHVIGMGIVTFLSFTIARQVIIVTFLPVMNDKRSQLWSFTSYEWQKGHNCDLSVTFLPVINDIVDDKKGHNFMNDTTYWFSGNFCLAWKKYWESSSFFCQTGSPTILDFYLKNRSQEVGCVFWGSCHS